MRSNRFPIILLSVVMLITVVVSVLLVYINRQDPRMQMQQIAATGESVTEEETADVPEEESSEDESPADASSFSTGENVIPPTVSARSSTATAPVGVMPRFLPVEGEDFESPDEEAETTPDVTLSDREERAEARARQSVEVPHLVSASTNPPEPVVTYDQIWAQFETNGPDYRFDAAYDRAEEMSNRVVDDVYIEMTRLRAGTGSEEVLLERLAELESIDVTAFASSQKLIVQRSVLFLDWQNVTVAQYAENFADAYAAGNADGMMRAISQVRGVYAQMTYETDYRYQIANTY